MAKLSAHGQEAGRVYFTTSAKAYFSDGKILKNNGFGWKLAAKLKPGVTPEQAFKNQEQQQAEYLAARPALAAYRKELHSMAGLSKRWKLHAAVSMMPDDCDGYGDNVHADVSEVAELCRLYAAAQLEAERMGAPATTA